MRLRVSIVVAAAFAVALAGCGKSSSGGGTPAPSGGQRAADVVARASTVTQSAGSARTVLDVAVTGVARPTTVHGEGAFDFRHSRGTLDLQVAGLPQGSITMVVDGTVIYEKVPALAGASGKPWIKLDLSKAAAGAGGTDLFGSNDPTRSFAYLKGISNLTEVGPATVRGAATREYRGTIDLAKVADQLPADSRAAYRKGLAQLGSTTAPAQIWVDDQGRLRKLKLSLQAQVNGQQATTVLTTEYYDFGAPVQVTIPPADQVNEVSPGVPGATTP